MTFEETHQRSKKIKDLRAEAAVHFLALKNHLVTKQKLAVNTALQLGDVVRLSSSLEVLKIYQRINMRQLWNLAKIYKQACDKGMRPFDPEPRHALEIKLFRAGVAYYGAKNPRIKQELMWERLNSA